MLQLNKRLNFYVKLKYDFFKTFFKEKYLKYVFS